MDSRSSSLPLQIRKAIRDDFERADSEVSLQSKELSSSLGASIVFNPGWPDLWTALESESVDRNTFVSKVAKLTVAFCEVWVEILQQPDSDDLFEGFLSDLSGNTALTIGISPDLASKNALPHVTWQPREVQMTLAIPPGFDKCSQARGSERLSQDVLSILSWRNGGEGPTNTSLGEGSSTERAPEPRRTLDPSPKPSALPRLDEISRPEDLLRKPPYHLIIEQSSRSHIVVQCSHSGALVLLEEYLKKWTRASPNHGGPQNQMARIQLKEISFGVSRTYDSLTVEAFRTETISPMVVLAFAQQVLAFEVVSVGNVGSRWHLTRASPFI